MTSRFLWLALYTNEILDADTTKYLSVTLHPNYYLNLVKCHICLMICSAHTIYSGNEVENNEIGATCGTCGG